MPIAVVMERRKLANRWQSERWEPVGIVPDAGEAGPRLLVEDSQRAQWLHPGFAIELHRDEAEGYYLNLTTATPYVFVMWRMEDDGLAAPKVVTVSYHEAGRMMDGGEQVDGVPMPAGLMAWVDEFVRTHYQPEPKKQRIRPPSFKGAKRD